MSNDENKTNQMIMKFEKKEHSNAEMKIGQKRVGICH